MGRGVGARIEVVIVARLVDADAPENGGGVVPVPADHAADVVDRQILPGCIPDMLPAGYLLQYEQAQLIAGVQKVPRLGVVRGAHDVALQVLAQDLRVAALHAPRHCGADEWKGLMAVESAKLYDFAVELKAVIREARASEAKAALILVEELSFAQQPYADAVQGGVLEVQQFHGRQGGKADRVSRWLGASRGVGLSQGV